MKYLPLALVALFLLAACAPTSITLRYCGEEIQAQATVKDDGTLIAELAANDVAAIVQASLKRTGCQN